MLLAYTVAACGIGVAAWLGLVPTAAPKTVPVRKPVAARAAPTATIPVPAAAQSSPKSDRTEQRPVESSAPKRAPKREYALLTVASDPWGTLYIDNVEIGPTPVADYRLSPGSHRLRIEQEGYRTKKETIVVEGPNPIRRRYSLEPQ